MRTDPDEAAAFVATTGVDALAVAVGSSHAMTTRDARLDYDLITRHRSAVPVPLVLHYEAVEADRGARRDATLEASFSTLRACPATAFTVRRFVVRSG